MKINFVFIVLLVGSLYISKSTALIFKPFCLNRGISSLAVHGKTAVQKKSKSTAPFQGKKMFCSADSKAKYIITIMDDSVLIASDRIKIKGVFKKDKLFTNDRGEVEYRRFLMHIMANILLLVQITLVYLTQKMASTVTIHCVNRIYKALINF